jgi:hypothetical protein
LSRAVVADNKCSYGSVVGGTGTEKKTDVHYSRACTVDSGDGRRMVPPLPQKLLPNILYGIQMESVAQMDVHIENDEIESRRLGTPAAVVVVAVAVVGQEDAVCFLVTATALHGNQPHHDTFAGVGIDEIALEAVVEFESALASGLVLVKVSWMGLPLYFLEEKPRNRRTIQAYRRFQTSL